MKASRLSTWVWVTSQPTWHKPLFSILRQSRNLVGALLLSAASLSFGQEKPHGLAEDVNFWSISAEHTVLPSDPSPIEVWHRSLDADVSLLHTGTRWEVDEGIYASSGIHWWADNYSLAAHYVSNLSRNRSFEWHAIKNEMELRWLFLHHLTSKTQFQWWVWAFTEQPLENTHEASTHASETHDVRDSHDAHDPKKTETDKTTHDSSSHHERLTIIAPTMGLQHKFSDRLRLLFTGSAGFDMKWSPHVLSSVEMLGTANITDRLALVYSIGFNHATWIGNSFEWSAGFVYFNNKKTWKFFFVADLNHNTRNDNTLLGLRTGFSLNLERRHH